jgi:hypothetical protein
MLNLHKKLQKIRLLLVTLEINEHVIRIIPNTFHIALTCIISIQKIL